MANDILKFADTATNILTQVEYAADPERNSGNIPGVARSKLVNKVLRQCAFISNGFAAYLISRVGGDVLDNDDSVALLAKITSAFTFGFVNPNYVVNGNFDFWQENSTFNVSSNKTYTADQFFTFMTGSTSVVSRQATAGTESFNAKYFKRSTVTSSAGAGNYNGDSTPLEDVRVLAGKTVTVSFWAKADASKNISLELVQYFGTGGSPSAQVDSLGVQKFALTTSWQKFTKTVTLPSISGKILGSNNNSFTEIKMWFDAGSTFNSRTDSLGQQSGTFDIAQLKVESGSEATAFCLSGLNLDAELKNCQRFYEKSYDVETNPGSNVGRPGSLIWQFGANTGSTSQMALAAPYKATKRATPTTEFYDGAGNASRYSSIAGGTVTNNLSSGGGGQNVASTIQFGQSFTVASAINGFFMHWTSNARL